MALANFLKVITVTPTTGAPYNDVIAADHASTTYAHIARTYNDAVPSADNISVSINGQKIGTSSSSKYYYTISSLPAASFTIDIYGNHSYISPGYSGTGIACSFALDDRIYIEYTYQLSI